MSKLHRSRLDTCFAHDGRDPRGWPQTRPCREQHVLQQSYNANQHGAWISCARCALRLGLCSSTHCSDDVVSTPSSASDGTDLSATGKCSDDGRGPLKNLSGRLVRKLQRSASLINAGLSKQIQSVLDVAVVDRCDFVEICCSDAPCLTEAMQQRGISSSPCCAQTESETTTYRTREKAPGSMVLTMVIAHQKNSTRCSLRVESFFRVCGSSLAIWWSQLLGMAAKCAGWSSVELRDFRAQQKSCCRELFMTACGSCRFAKTDDNLLGTSSLAIPCIRSSFQRVPESTVSRKSRTRVETNTRRQERVSSCNDSKVGERFCS